VDAAASGKTWLAFPIAGAVATGQTFADQKVHQRPVRPGMMLPDSFPP